ncbi:MAG: hypothetical protein Q8O19_07075 [Rectinemataceae bacterium]|nr:hypothetical protein [Rectinemataceae bacterium]
MTSEQFPIAKRIIGQSGVMTKTAIHGTDLGLRSLAKDPDCGDFGPKNRCLVTGISICVAFPMALALEELDTLKTVDYLSNPDALMLKIQTQSGSFELLARAAGAYLNERGLIGGCL